LGWKNIEDFESKYEWHAESRMDTVVNAQMLNYLVNSKEYRNKAATYLIVPKISLAFVKRAGVMGSARPA
jgi:hypothetical protein